METVDVAGSKFDVEDQSKYEYLEPIWEILANTPSDTKITSKELWEQSELDPVEGNRLIQELFGEFRNKMLKNIVTLLINKKAVVNSWAFDKMMLLSTRVDTGSGIELGDNAIMNTWKKEWLKKRGM